MSRYVRAVMTSVVTPSVFLKAGEIWAADDPLVVAHPEWFSSDLEPIARRTGPPVVDGEPRRGPGRPRKIETTEQNIEVTA